MTIPRHILIGITGGIAAYKIPELIRRLCDQGHEVRVILTEGGSHFVTPVTLQAVSGQPIYTDIWQAEESHGMGHIGLAKWADQILIAPATADCIARLTHGYANDLLSTVCLATLAPIAIAPAMNCVMWEKAAVQDNLTLLQKRGIAIWGPDEGPQACGDVGFGRMLEVAELLGHLSSPQTPESRTSHEQPALAGKKILITAGPTHEPIDPVRYLGNRSSGKMGYALATAAQRLGAEVLLIAGPTNLAAPLGIETVSVKTADQMRKEVLGRVTGADIFISAAAVCDYRVEEVSPEKIKKSDQPLSLSLTENPDILAEVAVLAKRPYCIGFAAETESIKENALIKLKNKNLDMIVANDVSDGQVFDEDTNTVWYVTAKGDEGNLGPMPKLELAYQLLELLVHSEV